MALIGESKVSDHTVAKNGEVVRAEVELHCHHYGIGESTMAQAVGALIRGSRTR